MTECDEVATNIVKTLSPVEQKACSEDICACDTIVQNRMPDESYTVRSNVADSLHYICIQRIHDGILK